MNYNSYNNENKNDLYNTYTENDNNTKKIQKENEEPKRSVLNKIILGMFYIVIIVIGYYAYVMYLDTKYEFYIEQEEILIGENSSYQIELKPKDERYFEYGNYKYESTNKEVAIVDETGKVTATGIGEAEIKIKYKNGYQEKTVKIKTEELGNSELKSAYENGQIETVVEGREDLNVDVDYTSTSPDIDVDEYGHVEGNGGGTVLIRKPNGETEEIEIPIEEENIEVERLEVIENNISIKVGTKGKINVKISPENASDKTLMYVSDNGNVEVDNNGNISGINVGKSVITITSSNGNKAYCTVNVTEEDKKIEKIDINPKEIEMKVGETEEIIADITPIEATEREIIWESSNEKVATVVSGKVTGVGIGEAEVVARTTDGRIRESSKIKVKANTIEVKELKLSASKIALKVGSKYNLQVEVVPTDATNQKLTYKSNNDNVRVDADGLVTANKVGKSVITITSNNGKSVECEVEVTTNEVAVKSIKLNTSNIEIKKGESYYAKATVEPVNATDSNVTWTSSNTKVATVTNSGKIVGKSKGEATITAKTTNGKSASVKVTVTVPVTSVTITGESKIKVGGKTTYKVDIKPTDASDKNVKWSSSNTKIASIDNKGNITGKGVGIATITATSDGKKATKTIQVVEKETPVTSIEITPKEVTLEIGHTTTATLTVNYTPDNATGQSIKEWKSDNPSVAKVSSNGTITAVKVGTATITAKSSNGKTATCKVTVKPNSSVPTKVTLNYSETQELNEGATLTLKATLEPNGVKDTLTWTSSNTKVVTVKNGKVTAIKAGTSVIKVKTSNEKEAKVTIKVNKKINEVTSVSVTPLSVSLNVGDTYKLKATVNPSNATDKTITWTSSNTGVATVKNGVVTAVKAGNTIITAKSSNGKTAACKVTIKSQSEPKNESYEGIRDRICSQLISKESLDYKDFQNEFKKYDEFKTDDYYSIKATHECANDNNKAINLTKSEYHIYKRNDDGPIIVNTDTNFNNSTIYIHDEDILKNGKIVYNGSIYQIGNAFYVSKTITINNELAEKGNFKISEKTKQDLNTELSKYGEEVDSYYVYITDHDKNRKIFIRSGKNQNDGQEVQDGFRVKNDVILDPIKWKYKGKEVGIAIFPISNRTLKFEHGIFKTIASSGNVAENISRNIKVMRSNVTISNINHSIIDAKNHKKINELNYGYSGFFTFIYAANVNFNNSKVQATVRYDKDKNRHSSYDIGIRKVVNMKLSKITMDDIENAKLWGVTGTNFNKNITYEDCTLNRIDTHCGVYNLTVKNTILGRWRLLQIGFGDLIIDSVTVKNANEFISLRDDYGSIWHGNIILKGNNVIEPGNNNPVYLISVNPEKGHKYGYKLYLPNVTFEKGSTFTIKSKVSNLTIFNQTKNDLINVYKYQNIPKVTVNGTIKNNSKKIDSKIYK